MIGLAVLYTTNEPKVVRNYIIALWLADFTHIGSTAYYMGYDAAVDVMSWNALTWGNIGFTVSIMTISWNFQESLSFDVNLNLLWFGILSLCSTIQTKRLLSRRPSKVKSNHNQGFLCLARTAWLFNLFPEDKQLGKLRRSRPMQRKIH